MSRRRTRWFHFVIPTLFVILTIAIVAPLADSSSAPTARSDPDPALVAAQHKVDNWRRATWRCQDSLKLKRTRSSFADRRTESVAYVRWVAKVWVKRYASCTKQKKTRLAVVKRLNAGLAGYPLGGYGAVFEREGWEHNINPYMVAAIAGKESTFGKALCGHNPFGWSPYCQFSSFEQAIAVVTRGLRENYLNRWHLYTVSAIGHTYCVPPDSWIRDVSSIMTQRFGSDLRVTYR